MYIECACMHAIRANHAYNKRRVCLFVGVVVLQATILQAKLASIIIYNGPYFYAIANYTEVQFRDRLIVLTLAEIVISVFTN